MNINYTTVLVSKIYLFLKNKLKLLSKDALIKIESKNVALKKFYISNECFSFKLSIHEKSWGKIYHGFQKKSSSITVFNIDNTTRYFLSSKSATHIRMISE